MDPLGRPSTSALFLCAFSLFLLIFVPASVHGQGGLFNVQRQFGRNAPVDLVSAHNDARRAQLLSVSVQMGGASDKSEHNAARGAQNLPLGVDLPIAGHTRMGMYWTDLEIGTPPRKFRVHVDTGSHLLWVNGKDCIGCPIEDKAHGIYLPPYDPHTSKTARVHESGERPCRGLAPGKCDFSLEYFDRKIVEGRYVTDLITYNQVSGDHQVQPARANITFGYVTRQINVTESYKRAMLGMRVEGLLGFSGEVSMFSQLASSGKARKVFAHCLDINRGGGIFTIGHVVKPEVKVTTPLLPDSDRDLYEARMTSVEVGGKFAHLRTLPVKSNTIFDCGFATGLIPYAVHEFLVHKITSNIPNMIVFEDERTGMTCFRSPTRQSEVRDEKDEPLKQQHQDHEEISNPFLKDFPAIVFHFDALTLKVNADDYTQIMEDSVCLVWTKGGNEDGFIFGDVFMSNKLVVYDLENKVIGWTEYNCTKGVEIEGDMSGKVCSVDAHGDIANTEYPTLP